MGGLFIRLASRLGHIIVSILLLFGSRGLLLLLGLLVLLKLLQVSTHELQELLFQVHQLLHLLLLLLIIDSVVLLSWLLQLSLPLCYFQVLLSAELSLEYLLHDFLLLWLEGLIIEGLAQAHH